MAKWFVAAHDGVTYRIRFQSWLPLLTGHDCITLGSTIYTRRSSLHRHTVAHEFAHVLAWKRFGVWGFLRRYLREQCRHGYQDNPFEQDAHAYADAHETEFPMVSMDGAR